MQENETADTAPTEDTESTATGETTETGETQTENTIADDQPIAADDNQTDAATVATTDATETGVAETEAVETAPETPVEPEEEEEITYHAVQKEESVTAIWEMQGRKHIRTIDPRSREGAEILRLFTAEEGEEAAAA